MAQAPIKKPLHKRWTVWLLVILVLYTLLGFLVLPWWLERALPDQLEQRMGWSASVAEVKANPYAMSVSVQGLAASDGEQQPVLRFDRLHLDLGFLQLFRGVVALETIDLDQPYLRVDLLEDYGINLLRDWQTNNPGPAQSEPAQDGGDSEPVKLYFGRISLNEGEVLLRDFSKEEEARFEIQSLDLVLNDLTTFPSGNGSGYRFDAALGEQSLAWEGQLSLVPFESSGRLRIENLAASTIGHFAAPYLPYQLREGRLTLESDYRIATRGGLLLETADGRITVSDLAMATGAEAESPDLTLASLVADSIQFSFGDRQLAVGEVSLQGLDGRVARAADGSLNLMRPLADDSGNQDPEQDASDQAGGSDQPFRWSVARVSVDQSRVQWQDAVPAQDTSLEFSEIQLSLEGLSHELADPVSYDAGLAVAGGRVSGSGQMTLSPFTLEAGVSAQTLSLAAAEGYLKELANLDVKTGQLSLDGDLDLDGQTDPLTGTFSGSGEVADLAVTLPGQQGQLLSWQSVRLEPIEYNLAPARLEIGTVSLVAPKAIIEREPSGALNIARVLGDGQANDSGGQSDAGSEGEDSGKFIFRVGEVLLEQGAVNYTDRSLDRAFAIRLHQLSGSVTGLSNVTPQQGQVNLTGKVAEAGDLAVDGTLAALGSEEPSSLNVTLKQLSLPTLSPYFARYLGYTVDGGKLGLDLDYQLRGTQLSGTNQIVLDRLELGQSVASEQAVDAPVKLGLALLRGSGGRIDISIPIDGDLEDPNFQIGGVVMGAFANLVIKAATSPFSMLGSIADLAGLTGPELGAIGFQPGTVELGEGETKKLEALSEALKQRPGLVLDIRGAVAPAVDGPVLSDNGEVPKDALEELATRRGERLQGELQRTYGVDGGQLFLRDPLLDANLAEGGELVRVPFELQAR